MRSARSPSAGNARRSTAVDTLVGKTSFGWATTEQGETKARQRSDARRPSLHRPPATGEAAP